jgi:hypothetical protein
LFDEENGKTMNKDKEQNNKLAKKLNDMSYLFDNSIVFEFSQHSINYMTVSGA